VLPLLYVRIIGEPANTEHDVKLLPVVEAQFVFGEPAGGQLMLNTRLGWAAKVRKVFAFACEGVNLVRSALFTVTPSPNPRHPAGLNGGEVCSTPDAQPAKIRLVPGETSEFPPLWLQYQD
jgi:hypothetical protein